MRRHRRAKIVATLGPASSTRDCIHALFDAGVKSRALAGQVFKLVMPLLSQSAAEGARPTLHAALADDVRPGDYFGPDGFSETRGAPKRAFRSKAARNQAVEDRLWEVSCELTGAAWSRDTSRSS